MKIYPSASLSTNYEVAKQLDRMRHLGEALSADFSYVSHNHTSKSINLPVATYEWTRWTAEGKLMMRVRDNFHDINLLVMANSPIALPLDVFYKQRDFAWYQEEIEKTKKYCFRDWTDEELEDPRILRVKYKNGNGWRSISGTKKDRWTTRMESTEWYGNDWSGGELIPLGPVPFTDETVFYHAETAYAEGIPEHAGPYTGPCAKFILALNSWDELIRVSSIIVKHVEANHS